MQLPIKLVLRGLWVGIGCKKGSSQQLIAAAIDHIFRENQLDESAIVGFATIDTKASEVGLVELCHLYNLPLRTFPAAILSSVSVPNPAKITENQVGTPSVAEAAAILAASHLVTEKVGLSVSLLVPKQIFRLQGQPGVVTVAVTQELHV
jgi:cobalt-precorrin 5A hydrolase